MAALVSLATMASAMSIPVVTPAEVQTLPSSTKMACSSTCTLGNAAANGRHALQCDATRRPSINCNAARMKVPAQMEP
jgi:hypothetical protein